MRRNVIGATEDHDRVNRIRNVHKPAVHALTKDLGDVGKEHRHRYDANAGVLCVLWNVVSRRRTRLRLDAKYCGRTDHRQNRGDLLTRFKEGHRVSLTPPPPPLRPPTPYLRPVVFTVLGAGLQGCACAYDLLQQPATTEVRLADRRPRDLPAYLKPHVGGRLSFHTLDANDAKAVARVVRGSKAVMCAMPYQFNLALAHIAVTERVHFSDLGGNTEIVFRQHNELDDLAKAHGVSVIPDCGLAPGLVNIVAQMGIRRCDTVSAVRLFVGGLPQHPEPPLNYQLVYSLEGMLDYSTTPSWVLRDGARTQVTALSERVTVDFAQPLGRLEAFHTAGGLSTMAFRYEGRIGTMEYKTLRYPGHAQIIEAMRELGFFSLDPIDVNGQRIVPRQVSIAVMEPSLRKPASADLVALRVIVEGTKASKPVRHEWELVDHYDAERGITAMMRTTGYSLSITGQMQASGAIDLAGVYTPDECVPGEAYLAELAKRGVIVSERSQ